MTASYHEAYLEGQILTADPLELVRALYRSAIDAVRSARVELAQGNIAERARYICRAVSIVGELAGSLDHERGGSLSRRLAELYDFVLRRLTDANRWQKAEPLSEAEGVLVTLLEGWEHATLSSEKSIEQTKAAVAPERLGEYNAYADFGSLVCEGAAQYSGQSWSC
jgi:flagellar secretion chaperone FliS